MLDQNTDRMWYVIGAVIIGAAIIFILNGTMPELFASVGGTFESKAEETSTLVDGIGPIARDETVVTEGLSVYYDFTHPASSDMSSIEDLSGHHHTGQLIDFDSSSGSKWEDDGLVFDGVDDYIKGPSGLSFPDETMTVEARVQFKSLDHDGQDGKLVPLVRVGDQDNLLPSHQGFTLSYDNRYRRTSFVYTNVGNASGGNAGGGNAFSSGYGSKTIFKNDTWYTLSMTVDGDSIGRLYLDGQLLDSRQFEGVQLNSDKPLYIGKWNDRYSYMAPMKMQSVRVYNRALSDSEIMQNYRAETK